MDPSTLNRIIELTKAIREETFKLSNTLIQAKINKGQPIAEMRSSVATIKRLIKQVDQLAS